MQLSKKYSGSQSSLSVSSRYLFKAPAGQVFFQTMNFKEPFWSTFNRRDPGWHCFTEWHLWVLAVSKDGCGLAAMWGRTTCLFIKHWDSPFKSAEETRMKSLMPRSIVRGALLDDEILPDCRVYFYFYDIRGFTNPEGTKGGRMERMKPPGCAALQVWSSKSQGSAYTVHLFNIIAASRLHPEDCSSTTCHREPPCTHIRLLLTFRGREQKFPFSFTALPLPG